MWDGKTPRCKECIKLDQLEAKVHISNYQANYYIRHKEKLKAASADNHHNNKERSAAQGRKYRATHTDEIAEYLAKYAKNNKGAYNARSAKRKAVKHNATTLWTEFKQIKKLYEKAAQMRASDIEVHVDHIIPLQHKLVCGLHVIANLRILDATENRRKGNRYTP